MERRGRAGRRRRSAARSLSRSSASHDDGEDPAAGGLDAVDLAVREMAGPSSARTGSCTIAAIDPCSTSSIRSALACRGGAGSMTRPPPTVVVARSTTRSPRAATTGSREPELRPAFADSHDPREHRAGAVVDEHARRYLRERLEHDVEPVARRIRTRRRRARRRAGARSARCPAARRRRAVPAPRGRPLRRAPARCARAPAARRARRASSSPSPSEPDQSVPVATVPIPRSENTRST